MTESTTPPESDFRLFLQKIAIQGFYFLGLVEAPGQPRQEANLPMCRVVIDDLILLREKTDGNLSEGEQQTLDKYITDLQLLFVETQKKATAHSPE